MLQMVPFKPGMGPGEAWAAFIKTMGLEHDPNVQAVFFAGFQAGLGYLGKHEDDLRRDAFEEIERLLGLSDAISAHKA